MCGIVGFINIGNLTSMQKSLDVIKHRGPDDFGEIWFSNSNSGLGHRRLSILDLSKLGHQPMSDDEKKLWITFNGEIYNYLEIKKELLSKGYKFKSKTDTEVLLYSYKEWGPKCLEKFNGIFAFAIWDNEKKILFAARDRLGVKPFYYSVAYHGLLFSSEIKAILASGLVVKQPDYSSIITPTRFQISPNTGFEKILKLPPANYILFSDNKLVLQKYWDIKVNENETKFAEVANDFDYLINDAVKLQMIADVPVGIFLSGGLDSSIIAALMRKNSNKNIHSYTIKFTDKDEKIENSGNDSFFSRVIAKKFNFIHHEFEIQSDIMNLLPKLVYYLDEPLTDPAAINLYQMAKVARETGTIVTLNGMGGDEIHCGYRSHLACLLAGRLQHILPKFLWGSLGRIANEIHVSSDSRGYKWRRWFKRFTSFAFLPEFERFLASDIAFSKKDFELLYNSRIKYEETYYFKYQMKNFVNNDYSYLTKMSLNDTNVFLPEHNLLYSDKATMAMGIESRPPLTDHRIVEFMFSLDESYKIKCIEQKYLLKKISEKYLPKNIIYRSKASFSSPLRSWIKGPLKNLVEEYLSENELKKRDIWDYKFVLQMIKRDKDGVEDNAFYIYQLLTTQIWFDTFFN